jgi:hypothetical protein
MAASSSATIVCPDTRLYDDFAHRPFICTNEEKHKASVQQLQVLEPKGDTVIGVSCFAVLNMAAVRPIPTENLSIVVIDRGVRVIDFWEKVHNLILESPNRIDFLNNLLDLYYDQQAIWGKDLPPTVNYGYPVKVLQNEIKEKCSWLSTDESFERIREVALRRNFFICAGDISRPEDMKFIEGHLTRLGKTIDLVYVSNCHEYMDTTSSALEEYASCIDTVAKKTLPYVVTTRPRESEAEPLEQVVSAYGSKESMRVFWSRPKDPRAHSGASKECFYFEKIATLKPIEVS